MQRYPHAPSEFHARARKKLAKKMLTGSVLIIASNQKVRVNADSYYPFTQDSDFQYLTGIQEENSLLVLKKDNNSRIREYLLIPKTSDLEAIWEGEKLTKKEARRLSGVEEIEWIQNKSNLLTHLIDNSTTLYLQIEKGNLKPSQKGILTYIRRKFSKNIFESAFPLLHSLRVVKEEEEIALIKKAIEITAEGFEEILPAIKPKQWEFNLESALLKTFLDRRSKGFAFDPIIASGSNSCILHYIQNRDQLKAGQSLLLDIGAEYGGYKADITRVIPVTTYSEKQRQVVEAVDDVLVQSIPVFKPGTTINQINQHVAALIEQKLLGLGLLTEKEIKSQKADSPAYRKYYMHSASHFLGLDVHDVGNRESKLQAGMVLTLEPGIYVREWNFGVRLEEDILITKTGCTVLSGSIPRRLD